MYQQMHRHLSHLDQIFPDKLPMLVWNDLHQDPVDLPGTPTKSSWSSTNLMNSYSSSSSGGSYVHRYRSPSNPLLAESLKASEKGFTLLPNKYSNHNGELPTLIPGSGSNSGFSSGNGSIIGGGIGGLGSNGHHLAFGDLNSNGWIHHHPQPEFTTNILSFTAPNGVVMTNGKGGRTQTSAAASTTRSFLQPLTHVHDKFMESRRETTTPTPKSMEESDSDPDSSYQLTHRQLFQDYGGAGEGNWKIPQTFQVYHMEEEPETKRDLSHHNGDHNVNSAASTTTRDSGVSSLKSSTMLPSPPNENVMQEYPRQRRRSSTKTRMPSNSMLTSPTESPIANSRSWKSTPDVPNSSKTEDPKLSSYSISTKAPGKNIEMDLSRSQSGFLHRKPVLARSTSKKSTMEVLQHRVSALELHDLDRSVDDETEPDILSTSRQSQSTTNLGLGTGSNNSGSRSGSGTRSPADQIIIGDKPQPQQPFTFLQRSRNPLPSKTRLPRSIKPTYNNTSSRINSNNVNPETSPTDTVGNGEERVLLPAEPSPPRNISNKKIVPKRVFKGSFRDMSRGSTTISEVFPADLKPVDVPRQSLPKALAQLASPDWETNLDGFRLLVRLIRHHPDTIRGDLHNINITGIKHLMNLRSQVCRSACVFFKELFNTLGKSMEQDCEKISEKLLDKAADTNKFIREDSAAALEAMVNHLSPLKVLAALDLFGTKHRNPVVRTMAARMTAVLVKKVGADKCMTEFPDKLLPLLIRFLQEGSLETRTHAKTALSELVSHKGFDSQLKRCIPADTLRQVTKSIASIKSEMVRQNV